MKIHDSARVSQLLNTYGQNGRVRGAQTGPSAPSAQRDGVSFSQEALTMSRELQEQTPERAAHLAALKQEIQSGTYHVEAGDVVRKILAAYGEY